MLIIYCDKSYMNVVSLFQNIFWIVCFWNFLFNFFRMPFTTSNWNHGNQTMDKGAVIPHSNPETCSTWGGKHRFVLMACWLLEITRWVALRKTLKPQQVPVRKKKNFLIVILSCRRLGMERSRVWSTGTNWAFAFPAALVTWYLVI